jgi:hypothetical protein
MICLWSHESDDLCAVPHILRQFVNTVRSSNEKNSTAGRLTHTVKELPQLRCKGFIASMLINLIKKNNAISSIDLPPQLCRPSHSLYAAASPPIGGAGH